MMRLEADEVSTWLRQQFTRDGLTSGATPGFRKADSLKNSNYVAVGKRDEFVKSVSAMDLVNLSSVGEYLTEEEAYEVVESSARKILADAVVVEQVQWDRWRLRYVLERRLPAALIFPWATTLRHSLPSLPPPILASASRALDPSQVILVHEGNEGTYVVNDIGGVRREPNADPLVILPSQVWRANSYRPQVTLIRLLQPGFEETP